MRSLWLHPGAGLVEDAGNGSVEIVVCTLDDMPVAARSSLGSATSMVGLLAGASPRVIVGVSGVADDAGTRLERLAIVVEDQRVLLASLGSIWFDRLSGVAPAGDPGQILSQVDRLVVQRPDVQTAADLALLVMLAQSVSYTRFRRYLQRQLEVFEDGIYDDMERDRPPAEQSEAFLASLRRSISGMREALDDLNQTGMSMDSHLIWTGENASPGLAEEVDERIDRAQRHLSALADRQRQLVLTLLTRRQRVAQERFQRLAGFVSFAIIAPGLIATVYGASIYEQGDDHASAVIMMIAAMALTGLASAFGARHWVRRAGHRRETLARRDRREALVDENSL